MRFFAAFVVFIHHIEQIKNQLGFENFWHLPQIKLIGKLGVVLFFVLSGFLITYLLLAEKKETNTIKIKAFYIRRILRIWPLYFLIFLVSFFVLPHFGFFEIGNWTANFSDNFVVKFLLYFIFLPNVALALFSPVPFASQLWSIGVEEYFYIIWAPLIKKTKNVLKILFLVIIFYLGLKAGLKLLSLVKPNLNILLSVRNIVGYFSIDCMAIGGIFAYCYFNKNKFYLFCQHKYIFIFANVLLLVSLLVGLKIPFLHYEFYSILFGIIILNLATNTQFKNIFEFKSLNFLGKISYGIYMFHPFCIVVTLKLLQQIGIENFAIQYLLSFAFTILISAASYQYFEKWFLRKKEKFKVVDSY